MATTNTASAVLPATAERECLWTPDLVLRAVRSPMSLATLSWAPYFPELFEEGLLSRIKHPSGMRPDHPDIAPPFQFPIGRKPYFLPGSIDDLLLYTSCVLTCCEAINRAWQAGGTYEDCGPPSPGELDQGCLGGQPWRNYWICMESKMRDHMAWGYQWVLHADVTFCAANIDTVVLTNLLEECGADHNTIRSLDVMHRSWQRSGCKGLPVSSVFPVLSRLYFLDIEQELRAQGVVFLRMVDDFRILCRSAHDKDRVLMVLGEALSSRGLRLNSSKLLFYRIGSHQAFWQRRRLALKGKFRKGVARPALVASLRWPCVRPVALSFLSEMNRRRLRGFNPGPLDTAE